MGIATGPKGEVANYKLIKHSQKLARKLYKIADNKGEIFEKCSILVKFKEGEHFNRRNP